MSGVGDELALLFHALGDGTHGAAGEQKRQQEDRQTDHQRYHAGDDEELPRRGQLRAGVEEHDKRALVRRGDAVAVNAQIAAIGLVQRPLRVEHGFLAGNGGDGIGVDVERFAAFVQQHGEVAGDERRFRRIDVHAAPVLLARAARRGRRFFAVPGGKIAAVVGKEGEHAVE